MDYSSIKKELCKFIYGNKNEKLENDLVIHMICDTNIDTIEILSIEETNYLRKICKVAYDKDCNTSLVNKEDLIRKTRKIVLIHKVENESNSYSIERLNIPQRVYKALKKQNISTINDLLKYNIEDLKLIDNLGDKSVNQIIEEVHRLGYKFDCEKEVVAINEKIDKLAKLLEKSKKLKEELIKVDEEIEHLVLSLEKNS